MAVFIIPPWYMGELELDAFVKCSKVRGIGCPHHLRLLKENTLIVQVEKFESLWPNVALSGDKPVQSRDVPVNENNLPHALWILVRHLQMDYLDICLAQYCTRTFVIHTDIRTLHRRLH